MDAVDVRRGKHDHQKMATPDDLSEFLERIGSVSTEARERLAQLGTEARRPVEEILLAIMELSPRGWSVASMPISAVRRALGAIVEESGEEADQLLADVFDGPGAERLTRICSRVARIRVEDDALRGFFTERARLLRLASDHHLAGRYDASIPILLAQIEGIVIDISGGKKFFTKGRHKADLSSPDRAASLLGGLTALQALFGEDVKHTQARGSLSRHGVLHGRELAYDTRVNSAKTWSVLEALVDWSESRAVEEVRTA
ncbi:hypothetical protein [Nocardioides sp. SYSU D00038]|uniref:hypothetical protein n=1 Tax=Nocardioides sp. SYSU D00038 TaxID=2812554 RepID=UPI00196882BE|nr:hypothetical protein [Nocardioides sp. SYSU D00038]